MVLSNALWAYVERLAFFRFSNNQPSLVFLSGGDPGGHTVGIAAVPVSRWKKTG